MSLYLFIYTQKVSVQILIFQYCEMLAERLALARKMNQLLYCIFKMSFPTQNAINIQYSISFEMRRK